MHLSNKTELLYVVFVYRREIEMHLSNKKELLYVVYVYRREIEMHLSDKTELLWLCIQVRDWDALVGQNGTTLCCVYVYLSDKTELLYVVYVYRREIEMHLSDKAELLYAADHCKTHIETCDMK